MRLENNLKKHGVLKRSDSAPDLEYEFDNNWFSTYGKKNILHRSLSLPEINNLTLGELSSNPSFGENDLNLTEGTPAPAREVVEPGTSVTREIASPLKEGVEVVTNEVEQLQLTDNQGHQVELVGVSDNLNQKTCAVGDCEDRTDRGTDEDLKD